MKDRGDGSVLRKQVLSQIVFVVRLTAHRTWLPPKIPRFPVWIVGAVMQFVGMDAAPCAFFAAVEFTIYFLTVSSNASLGRHDLFFHEFHDACGSVVDVAGVHLQKRTKAMHIFALCARP